MTRIMKTMLMAVLVVVLGFSVVLSQTASPPQAVGKSAAPGAAVVTPKDLVDLNSATVDQLKELPRLKAEKQFEESKAPEDALKLDLTRLQE